MDGVTMGYATMGGMHACFRYHRYRTGNAATFTYPRFRYHGYRTSNAATYSPTPASGTTGTRPAWR